MFQDDPPRPWSGKAFGPRFAPHQLIETIGIRPAADKLWSVAAHERALSTQPARGPVAASILPQPGKRGVKMSGRRGANMFNWIKRAGLRSGDAAMFPARYAPADCGFGYSFEWSDSCAFVDPAIPLVALAGLALGRTDRLRVFPGRGSQAGCGSLALRSRSPREVKKSSSGGLELRCPSAVAASKGRAPTTRSPGWHRPARARSTRASAPTTSRKRSGSRCAPPATETRKGRRAPGPGSGGRADQPRSSARRERSPAYREVAKGETTPEARVAAIEKAVEHVRSLRRAFDTPTHENRPLRRVLYGYGQHLAQSSRFDDAIKALDESSDVGFETLLHGRARRKMAELRKSPQFQAALKAHDAARLAAAASASRNKLANAARPAVWFTLRDLDSKPVSLSDFKGKVVLVDFWGTWCGPAGRRFPHLIELYRNRKDKGLEIWAWITKRTSRTSRRHGRSSRFRQGRGMTYPCLIGDEATIQQIPGFKGFPTTVIVDRAGKVRRTDHRERRQDPD